MNPLVLEIDALSDLALPIVKAMLDKEDQAKEIMGEENGPLMLASALSDFFQMAAVIDSGQGQLDDEGRDEFAAYGLDLLDRLSYLVRQLELMDHRNDMSRLFASMGVWLARQEATLDNLEGTADGFGWLVNGINDTRELAEMCGLMEEVIAATSETLQLDQERANPRRPWRVINLNCGIAATRSLDAELMDRTLEKLGRRLPYDMPGFLADGRRQIMLQEVPEAVREVMNRHAGKWPGPPAH